jgi:hypothetical protein
VSILRRSATQPSVLRWGFEMAYRILIRLIEQQKRFTEKRNNCIRLFR